MPVRLEIYKKRIRDSVKREDMSMSGFAEISRVFFLARRFSINRRKRDRICFWLKIR